MLLNTAFLALSVGMAALIGFVAAQGGICAVRAVNDLLNGRGGALFLGFLKCSVWVVAVTLTLVWTVVHGEHLAAGYALTWSIPVGGFLFGMGAAVNGGCAFSTVSHLGAGDLGAGFTLLGLGLGFALYDLWIGTMLRPPVPVPSPLVHPQPWSLALLATVWLWAAREVLRLSRPTPEARIDRAMAVIGLAGGALYALHGPWVYTAVLAQGAAWATHSGLEVPSMLSPLLFLAVLAGAALAACTRNRFLLRWPTRATVGRGLAGGVLMGIGAALVPGGNDALVLHALPGLALHAALAYAALVAGIGCTLLGIRVLSSTVHHT